MVSNGWIIMFIGASTSSEISPSPIASATSLSPGMFYIIIYAWILDIIKKTREQNNYIM